MTSSPFNVSPATSLYSQSSDNITRTELAVVYTECVTFVSGLRDLQQRKRDFCNRDPEYGLCNKTDLFIPRDFMPFTFLISSRLLHLTIFSTLFIHHMQGRLKPQQSSRDIHDFTGIRPLILLVQCRQHQHLIRLPWQGIAITKPLEGRRRSAVDVEGEEERTTTTFFLVERSGLHRGFLCRNK